MESAGTRLRNLRLEKGLTLEEVHKKTKLHLNVLKSIEDDSLVGINPIYTRGFLKIYCKFLGVDPKDYIPNYREPQYALRPAGSSSDSLNESKPLIGKRRLFKLNFSLKSVGAIIKPLFIIAVVIVFIVITMNVVKMIRSKRKAVPTISRIPAAALNKPETKRAPEKRKVAAVTAQPKKETPSVIRLGLRALENSWVDLKVDGKVMFRGELKKGKFESWAANDRIELNLGNAGVVELELDGRVIKPLGRKRQSIKGIRITKDEGLVMPR